jgi:hypothetical protein
MHPAILNKESEGKKRKSGRVPLHLPLGPESHDIENQKKKKKKSSNDYVININDEFIIDFDINKDKGSVTREEVWDIAAGYRL